MQVNKGRLKWLCRRGTKEMDPAMNIYLQHHYDAADPAEQQLFAVLLQELDPDIMVWLIEPDTSTRYDTILRKVRKAIIADT